jgi:site-specific recombinase XerD
MNEFIEWLRYNRGVSEYTIRNYSIALKLFDEYLKQI